MDILTLQWNNHIYNIGGHVAYLKTNILHLAKINKFQINNGECEVIGIAILSNQEIQDNITYNIYVENMVTKEHLPKSQECYISNTIVQFPLSSISHPICIVPITYYIHHITLQADINIYYWTHYIDTSNNLHRTLFSFASCVATPLLQEVSAQSTNSDYDRVMAYHAHASQFIWFLKEEMKGDKGCRRVRRVSRPFFAEGYHLLFDNIGDQIPPSVVTTPMVFTTFLYEEDLVLLDNKLAASWREKDSGRDKDTFMRINSLPRPVGGALGIKRKRDTKEKETGDKLFTVVFDIGTNFLTYKFSFHKYFKRDRKDVAAVPLW